MPPSQPSTTKFLLKYNYMRESKLESIEVSEFFNALGATNHLTVVSGKTGMARKITTSELNRPGMALTGYYDDFAEYRIQVLGLVEVVYLAKQPEEVQRERLTRLLQMHIPCVIVTRGYEPPPILLELSDKYGVPVMVTPDVTMPFMNRVSKWLDEVFSPRAIIHGELVEVFGVGVLIMGKSGVGKSECALSLVSRGHIFVADDIVKLRISAEDGLVGAVNERNGHHMELRGVGIVNVMSLYGIKGVRMEKSIDLVVTLFNWEERDQIDRSGLEVSTTEILGQKLPHMQIPVKPGRDVALLGIAVSYAATQGSHSRKQLENVVWHSLRHDGYVGGWLDKKSGLYYFDSTRLYPEDELKEAIQFGTVNGQRYVYVLSTGTSVKIGSENAAK